MTIYYILMALILGLSYPLCIKKPSDKKNIIYVCIVFGYMLIMSVLRYGLGNDYFHYRIYLYGMLDNGFSFIETMQNYSLEPGFVLLLKITQLLGGDYLILNLITALLILVPTAYVILRQSKMPWVSAWLYLTITFFYNSLNFTRQSLSVAIIFMGLHFFKERKHIAVVLIIIAASMFHISALVLLPVYFMSLITPSLKVYGVIGAAGLLVFVFSNQILSFATTYIFPQYAKYLNTIYVATGLSWKFLLIPAILMIILMAAYFNGWGKKFNAAAMLTNFSFYNFLIWMFIVKHFIIERFTMPIYIFMLIAVPEVLVFIKDYSYETSTDKKYMKIFKSGKNFYISITAFVMLSTLVYNQFCVSQGVHGVFPYRSMVNPVPNITKQMRESEYRALYTNCDLMQFLGITVGGDYTTVICVNGDAGTQLELPYKMMLKRLGFKTDFNKLEGKSYIGVVSGSKAVFEKTSDEVIIEKFGLYSGSTVVEAISAGSVTGEPNAVILVNGKPYNPIGNGLNFAVFDNTQQKIIAAQNYDTSTYEYTLTNSDAFYGEILIEE